MKKNCAVLYLLSIFFLLIAFSACSQNRQFANTERKTADGTRPLLALSILPQEWFVTNLAGDRVRTLVLAGPGQNPHSYEPSPRQMQGLAEAGAWVLSGAEFEISLLPKIKNVFAKLLIIDGTEGVSFRMIEDHDDQDANDEHDIDRHTWLGNLPSKILAAHIKDALVLIDPDGEEQYQKNYDTMITEIDAVFDSLRHELAPLNGSAVFVYHPSFGYFLDEFGIRQEALEAGGKEPGPRELSLLIDKAKQEHAAAIFVQAQFPAHTAKTVADAVGAQMVMLDPLSPDWLANIQLMGEVLKSAAMTNADTAHLKLPQGGTGSE